MCLLQCLNIYLYVLLLKKQLQKKCILYLHYAKLWIGYANRFLRIFGSFKVHFHFCRQILIYIFYMSPFTKHNLKIFKNYSLLILQYNDYTPLWHNKNLPEFLQLPDADLWSTYGIIYLHQLTTNGTLKTFTLLNEKFTLPSHMIFRFLQVKHAAQTQFPMSPPAHSQCCYGNS